MEFSINSKVSISEFEGIMIVSVNADLDETTLLAIQKIILNTIATKPLVGVVLNFSDVNILDSFLIGKLEDITQMIALMGTVAVVAGLRPEVVVSLVTLNIEPKSLITALNVELAIGMLREINGDAEEEVEEEEEEEEEDEENLEMQQVDETDESHD